MRPFLRRYRWAIFGVCAVALIAAAFYAMHARNSSNVAGVLGPTPGPNSSGHISAKRAYLERSARSDPSTKAAALISLARTMRPAEARALVPSGKLTAIFVKFPASDPEAIKITTSMDDAMNARANDLRAVVQAEISGLQKELGGATGARRTQIEAQLVQRAQGLASLRGDCACIYALVVENSTLRVLADEQATPGVRLVDVPDPPVASLAGWKLTPILPGVQKG